MLILGFADFFKKFQLKRETGCGCCTLLVVDEQPEELLCQVIPEFVPDDSRHDMCGVRLVRSCRLVWFCFIHVWPVHLI